MDVGFSRQSIIGATDIRQGLWAMEEGIACTVKDGAV